MFMGSVYLIDEICLKALSLGFGLVFVIEGCFYFQSVSCFFKNLPSPLDLGFMFMGSVYLIDEICLKALSLGFGLVFVIEGCFYFQNVSCFFKICPLLWIWAILFRGLNNIRILLLVALSFGFGLLKVWKHFFKSFVSLIFVLSFGFGLEKKFVFH